MRWLAFTLLLAAWAGTCQETVGADPGTKGGSDWPCFLGSAGTSVSTEKGIIKPWPNEGLKVVWHLPLGTGYGMPSISQGRLFQFDRVGDKSRLRCLKSTTGELVWTFDYTMEYEDSYGYNNGPRCCPVVDGDRVYTFGVEGMLYCLDVKTGKVIWKVDTAKKYNVRQNFFGVGSTPIIDKDLLIVQVGGCAKGNEETPILKLKGNGTGIIAFDKLTGKVKYETTDELASYASPVLATIQGRRWCFVFARGGLVGMDPATGKVDFQFPWRAPKLESVNASNPVVVGDKVFITECYGPGSALLEVKPGSSKVLWSDAAKAKGKKSMMCHWNTPIFHDGYVYGSSGRHPAEAELRCVELATGKIMWSEPRLTRTSLLMVDGHFVCLGENGVLRLLKVNPKKYEEVSRLEMNKAAKAGQTSLLEYPCWAAPILSHGLLYVRGKSRLICLELIK